MIRPTGEKEQKAQRSSAESAQKQQAPGNCDIQILEATADNHDKARLSAKSSPFPPSKGPAKPETLNSNSNP